MQKGTVLVKSLRIKLIYFRTLFSQSGASVTMGSLASYLRSKGFFVDLCFLEKENQHSLRDVLDRGSYDRLIIIAKPNFKDYAILFPLLRIMKESEKVSKVFFCGPFAALNAKSMIVENEWLDGIIIDQIESVSSELMLKIERNDSIQKCKGGIWREDNLIVEYVPSKKYISMDQLPLPARDVEEQEVGSYVNIEASRGCIYNCSFCHIPITSYKKESGSVLDFRDPVKVVDEIEFLNKKLRKKLFIFNDSVFWAYEKDNERILKFCSEIKRRELDIQMYVYLRCNPFINENVLESLVDIGLVRVFLGVESVSSHSQEIFKKPIKSDSFDKIKEKLDQLNVNIHIGYIVFEPFSTLDDVQLNIEYLYKIGKLFRLGTILEPVRVVPGSFIYKKLLKDGLLDGKTDYRNMTYGYKFLNDDVGSFFGEIKDVFSGDFGKIAYEFEYYCTTMNVLDCLIKREHAKFRSEIDQEHMRFTLIQSEMMKSTYAFLSVLLSQVRQDFLLSFNNLTQQGH